MRYGKDKRYHLANSKNVPRKARRLAKYHASKLWNEILWAGTVLRPTNEHRAHSAPSPPDVAHRLLAKTLADQWREANAPKQRIPVDPSWHVPENKGSIQRREEDAE